MSEQRLSARILDAFAGLDREGFDWESCRPLADEVAALEAKLETMRNAAAIAIVALAHYNTSDNELDNVREMLERAVVAAQQEQEDG